MSNPLGAGASAEGPKARKCECCLLAKFAVLYNLSKFFIANEIFTRGFSLLALATTALRASAARSGSEGSLKKYV